MLAKPRSAKVVQKPITTFTTATIPKSLLSRNLANIESRKTCITAVVSVDIVVHFAPDIDIIVFPKFLLNFKFVCFLFFLKRYEAHVYVVHNLIISN